MPTLVQFGKLSLLRSVVVVMAFLLEINIKNNSPGRSIERNKNREVQNS